MARNNKFNPNEAAKKFISSVTPEQEAPPQKVYKPPVIPTKQQLTQKAYYITHEQYRKIKVYAAEIDSDASSVVRAAIDFYFNNI